MSNLDHLEERWRRKLLVANWGMHCGIGLAEVDVVDSSRECMKAKLIYGELTARRKRDDMSVCGVAAVLYHRQLLLLPGTRTMPHPAVLRLLKFQKRTGRRPEAQISGHRTKEHTLKSLVDAELLGSETYKIGSRPFSTYSSLAPFMHYSRMPRRRLTS